MSLRRQNYCVRGKRAHFPPSKGALPSLLLTVSLVFFCFSQLHAEEYLGPQLSGEPAGGTVTYENRGLIKPQIFEENNNTSISPQQGYNFVTPARAQTDLLTSAQNAPQPLPIPQTPNGGYSLPNPAPSNPNSTPSPAASDQNQENVVNQYWYYDLSTGKLTPAPSEVGAAIGGNAQPSQQPGGQPGYTAGQLPPNYTFQQQQQYPALQQNYGMYNQQQINPYYQAGYTNPYYQNPYNPYANQYGNPFFQQQVDPYYANYFMQMQMQQQQMLAEWSRMQQEGQGNPNRSERTNQTIFSRLAPFKVSSPLLNCVKESLCLLNPFNVPETPHRGVGRPLEKDSWLDYPSYWGIQGGVLGGSELVSNMIDQKSGGIASLTYGKYFDNYWGYEFRFAYASLTCRDTDYAQEQYALAHGDSETYYPPLSERSNRILLGDVSIHYYPFGNARWRPYMKLGFGVANQRFNDTFGNKQDITTFSMPIGVGVRFWWNKKIALNMELADNLMFQSGIAETQNNISFTVGITYAFGRSARHDPTVYWPFVPSSKY